MYVHFTILTNRGAGHTAQVKRTCIKRRKNIIYIAGDTAACCGKQEHDECKTGHSAGGWVGPTAGLDGAENLAPAGIRFPALPARSESLYRLSYTGHDLYCSHTLNKTTPKTAAAVCNCCNLQSATLTSPTNKKMYNYCNCLVSATLRIYE